MANNNAEALQRLIRKIERIERSSSRLHQRAGPGTTTLASGSRTSEADAARSSTADLIPSITVDDASGGEAGPGGGGGGGGRSSAVGGSESLPSGVQNSVNLIDERFPLHLACSLGHLHLVRLLLSAGGASVHLRDATYGFTPLFAAVRAAHPPIAQLLRATGAHLRQDEVALLQPLAKGDAQVRKALELALA